jgi:methionyl-tRNA synthetase
LRVVPEAARAETLGYLGGEVRDVCVSRDAARANGWGIPVPDDPSQVIYVWFDALTNYLTSIGRVAWRADVERTHVIGKGITRFHAVYWPAFLGSAGLPLPDRIAVHGYLTVDGEKISKSRRNVEVGPVVEQCGVDALRWFYARRCRTRSDADVSVAAILAAHDADLADRLGNLVQRCIALAHTVAGGRVPAPDGAPDPGELRALADALPGRVDTALDAFLPDEASAAIIELVDAANRSLERTAPWRLRKSDPATASAALYAPLEAARVAIGELVPFVPALAASLAERLGDPSLTPRWGELPPGAPLHAGPPPLPRRGRA